jgi:uncharacterized membrane protein (UPF0127 family)
MMTRFFALALIVGGLALILVSGPAAFSRQPADCGDQPYAEAQVPGNPRLLLELATTPDQRARGLMFRQSMPDNQGMLFVFETQTSGPFWNMNTLIPLSIAFIDRDGTILDIQDMKAQTPGSPPDIYPPARPYFYALEANQGWYANNGVAVGDVLTFCPPPSPGPQARQPRGPAPTGG